MPKICPVRGQPTDTEPGFYYGTGDVSYALGVALSITTFIAWFVLIGMSVNDNRFFYCFSSVHHKVNSTKDWIKNKFLWRNDKTDSLYQLEFIFCCLIKAF